MHVPLTTPAPLGTPASPPPPPPQGSGTVVPFNAPTAGSFADTLRSITEQNPTPSQTPAAASGQPAGSGINFTPPASANPSLLTGASSSGSSSPIAPGFGGTPSLTTLLQGLGSGASTIGTTPMELMLVPLQGGQQSGLNLSALLGGQTSNSLQMPFQGQAQITQPFGPTSFAAEPAYDGYSHFHTGIDFGVPLDTPIDAAAAGTVVAAGWDSTGYGNRVIIDHGNGRLTLYGHLDKITTNAGQVVQAGQQIGLSGSTGNSTGPHLHFGLEVNGQWVDPSSSLSSLNGSASSPSSALLQGLGGSSLTAGSLSGGIPLGLVMLGGSGLANPGAVPTASSGPLADPALSGLITQAAQATGVPSSLVAAVVQTESGGNPQAVSPAGAKGLMQLMDTTAAHYGVSNPFDPQQNLDAGTRYLQSLLQKYQGNEQLAVAAYNAGPGAVDSYGGVPPFPETQQYVQKVLSLQQQYSGQSG